MTMNCEQCGRFVYGLSDHVCAPEDVIAWRRLVDVSARLKSILGDNALVAHVGDDKISVELSSCGDRTRPLPCFTFEMLSKISEEFGTKLIDFDATDGWSNGEGSGEGMSLRLTIRGATR